MPDKQRTIEDQAARNRRGQQLLDRRDARYGTIYRRMMVWLLEDRIGMNQTHVLSFADLAEETEMSPTQAYDTAKELKEMGLIDYQETAPNSGLYQFRISRPNIAEMAEESRQEKQDRKRQKRGRPKKDSEENLPPHGKHFRTAENPSAPRKTFPHGGNAPYIERPLNDIQTNPITHAIGDPAIAEPARSVPSPKDANGDGVKKNAWGGWDSPIQAWQLTKIEHVEARYLEAVRKGWITPSEQDHVNFFALSRACAKIKTLKNPAASFTFFLKRKKWEVIRCEDLDAAAKTVASFRGGPGPAAALGMAALSTYQEIPREDS